MNIDRVVMIRFEHNGVDRMGSGLWIGGLHILTANHVAAGSKHKVVAWHGDDTEHPDWSAEILIRSPEPEVDLAVLKISETNHPQPALQTWLECARVDQRSDLVIEGCNAIGFPSYKKDDENYRRSAHAKGVIPGAEGSTARAGKGIHPGYLALIVEKREIQSWPPFPNGSLEESPWAGMSGAVVYSNSDQVLGVVRHHNPVEGNVLGLTSISSIDFLPEPSRSSFWAALGVSKPGHLPPPTSTAFSAADMQDLLEKALSRRTPIQPPAPVRRGSHLEDPGNLLQDRAKKIQEAYNALTSDGIRLLQVLGPHQYGKTALVTNVLNRIERNGLSNLSIGGVAQVSASERKFSFKAFTDTVIGLVPESLLEQLQTALDSSLPASIKSERLVMALPKKSIIVMDYMDAFLDDGGEITDAELLAFVDRFLSMQHDSVLVTTSVVPIRQKKAVPGRTVDLDRLADKDAVSLLKAVDRTGIVKALSAKQRINAVRSVYGIPGLIFRLPDVLMSMGHLTSLKEMLLETSELELTESLAKSTYENMPSSARAIMEALAVASRPEDPAILNSMLDDILDIDAALKYLIDRRLVRLESDQTVAIREIDQDYLTNHLQASSPQRLQELHAKAASYYKRERYIGPKWGPGRNVTANFLEADHLIRAQQPVAAAKALADVQDAAIWSGQAQITRGLLTQLPKYLIGVDRIRLRMGLAQCHIVLGPINEAVSELNLSIQEAEALGYHELASRSQVLLGESYRRMGLLDESIDILLQAIEHSDENALYDTSALLSLGLAYTYSRQLDPAKAIACRLNELANSAKGRKKQVLIGQAENILAMVGLCANELNEALSIAQSAVSRYSHEESHDGVAYMMNVLGMVQACLHNWENAVASLTRGHAYAEKHGNFRASALCLVNRSLLFIRAADIDSALHDAQSALPILTAFGGLESQFTAGLVDELQLRLYSGLSEVARVLGACRNLTPGGADIMPPEVLLDWATMLDSQSEQLMRIRPSDES